ncbi:MULTISPECIES: phosphoheptose isomerase [Oligella]|uniref:Phosphoheptose isomerase n=1 Tax=Oligella urethralis TaxID=90245 RepID=A0A2X1WKT5_9BURK|nr:MULTISPECIES: phosphoheptose isomerase [Oligella]OFS89500.1 phosphoheptose isomerase [Oligella sp. HMSC05A10]SPY07415.1 Phosphoheptose isomerase [Oligella urethralis]SUA55332.1 Phosphoheptose isomerase [Oligella urethralis]
MSILNRIEQHFQDHAALIQKSLDVLAEPLQQGIDLLFNTISNNGKVLACGNGGSAADAQHFIAELVGRFERERFPLAGVALNTDTSIMTAVGNDYGFDQVFERQVRALAQPADLLVAISTSGNSTNVIRAIDAAKEYDIPIIALTGRNGGTIGQMLTSNDVHLCVPHERTMRIQEVHILLLHILCDGLDAAILGD